MRILQLHCDSIEYTPTKKEIQSAENIENPSTVKLEELVVDKGLSFGMDLSKYKLDKD